jgi:hypothetical protein
MPYRLPFAFATVIGIINVGNIKGVAAVLLTDGTAREEAMRKSARAGRPPKSTKSTPFSVRLHPPAIAALQVEAKKRAKDGPPPTVVALIRWVVIEWLKDRGHKLDS